MPRYFEIIITGRQLAALVAGGAGRDAIDQKIGDLYGACMDVETVEARGVAPRLLAARPRGGQVGLGARQRNPVRLRVDREQRLSRLYRGAFLEVVREQDPRDARAHLHFARAGGLGPGTPQKPYQLQEQGVGTVGVQGHPSGQA